MATISIRPRQPDDLPALVQVLASVYLSDGYPVEGASNAVPFLCPPGILQAWTVLSGDRIVGQGLVTAPSAYTAAVAAHVAAGGVHDEIAVLGRLFVDQCVRGKGVGRQLILVVMRWAKEEGKRLVLDVVDKDVAAIRLYEKLGWKKIGEGMYDAGKGEVFPSSLYVSPE